MPSPVSARAIDALNRGQATLGALRAVQAKHWLKNKYSAYLYGGWMRPDGHGGMEPAPPHKKAMRFHEAAKALFCPDCWSHVGQMGEDETEVFSCRCGRKTSLRDCRLYSVLFVGGGHQSSKTFGAMSEYCSWMRGERPWDGSITAPKGQGRDWGIGAMSFTKAFDQVICPYFETRMGDLISDRVMNANKTISHYRLVNGDRVHCYSYEQYLKAGRKEGSANVFQQAMFYAFLWDEVPPPGARVSTRRGLVRARSAGWGREIIAATPIRSPVLFDKVYKAARNKGGDQNHIYAIEFSIYDNPSLTPDAIEEIIHDYPAEELEARVHGRFLHLAGRIYDMFDDSVHVWDEDEYDPLVTFETQGNAVDDQEPSDWPIIMSLDPHDRKPWAMGWYALSPTGDMVCVREWPDQPIEKMQSARRFGFDDYAERIREVELTLPGGPSRVLWREIDPNFGRRGVTASKGKSIRDELRTLGYYFRDDVIDRKPDGHAAVSTLLRYDTEQPLSELNRPKLFVLSRCRNHIWSFGCYTHPEHVDPDKPPPKNPKEQGKDHMDCVRYAVMRKPRHRDWREGQEWYTTGRAKFARRQARAQGANRRNSFAGKGLGAPVI